MILILKVFWSWMFNTLLHSLIIYFYVYLALGNEIAFSDGTIGDYLFVGCHVYTYCVIVVCIKSGLESDSWTVFTHISIWGSIAFWFLFLIIYSYFWPSVGIAPEMTMLYANLFRGWFFWIGMIFVPLTTLLIDISFKAYWRTIYKTEPQEIQEKEIRNEYLENLTKKPETRRLIFSSLNFTRTQSPQSPYRKNF